MAVLLSRLLVLRGVVGFAAVVRLGTDLAATTPAANPKPCAMPEHDVMPGRSAGYASPTPPAWQS